MKKILIGIVAIVSLSACEKEQDIAPSIPSPQHPRFSLQLPTCNWNSGELDPIDANVLVDNNSNKIGMIYKYEMPDFRATVVVEKDSITQLTGVVGVYTYVVNLSTNTMYLCSGGGSYPVTYNLIY